MLNKYTTFFFSAPRLLVHRILGFQTAVSKLVFKLHHQSSFHSLPKKQPPLSFVFSLVVMLSTLKMTSSKNEAVDIALLVLGIIETPRNRKLMHKSFNAHLLISLAKDRRLLKHHEFRVCLHRKLGYILKVCSQKSERSHQRFNLDRYMEVFWDSAVSSNGSSSSWFYPWEVSAHGKMCGKRKRRNHPY